MRDNKFKGYLGLGVLLILALALLAGCGSSSKDAIAKSDVELAKVAPALSAYTAAGGSDADPVYTDLVAAETALKNAKTANVAADITAATAALTTKLEALSAATALLGNAAATADTELAQVAAALSAYTAAGGSSTDAVYTDVTAAETELKAAQTAGIPADISTAVEKLTAKLAALTAATTGMKDLVALENAKAAANAEIAKVAPAQSAYIAIGGSNTDPAYQAVVAAQAALAEAKIANVTAQIISATETLTARLAVMTQNTAGFKDALQIINAGTATVTEFDTAAILGVTAENLQTVKNSIAGAKAVKGNELTRQEIQAAVNAVIK